MLPVPPKAPSTYSNILGDLIGSDVCLATVRRPVAEVESKAPVKPNSTATDFPAEPADENSNVDLIRNVRNPGRTNPEPKSEYDLVVLGAGVAGLISCIVGKQLGLKMAMVEQHYTGGDCLNTGCVPSKVLLASARRLALVRESADLGIVLPEGELKVDFGRVMSRIRQVRADISPHDSIKRYTEDVGVDVFTATAKFTGKKSVKLDIAEGGNVELFFRRCIIGTGASPMVPRPLINVQHLVSSNFWNLEDLPPRLLVIGAGPIGLEIAQAMQRLGSKVTVVTAEDRILAKEDQSAAQVIQKAIERDGVELHISTFLEKVERGSGGLYKAPFGEYVCTVKSKDGLAEIKADALLNATGRIPNTANLGLELAGVTLAADGGVATDSELRTANPFVYAAGDCLPGPDRFTHAAEWQARVAVRNAFLGESLDSRGLVVPRATYTDPEVAAVGCQAEELKQSGIPYRTFTQQAAAVDRMKCEGESEGFASLMVNAENEILGATIVGRNAGDHISEVTLCMQHGLSALQLAGTMHPYPTAAEVVRQAAQACVRDSIFKPCNQDILRNLASHQLNVHVSHEGGGVAVVSLDRPKALNALDMPMCIAIGEAMCDDTASVILLRGGVGESYKNFSSGGDVKSLFAALKKDPDTEYTRLQLFHEYRAIESVKRRSERTPVVVIMDGVTMGCGLGLASSAKYRVATERTIIAMPECNIGIAPDAGFSAVATSLPLGMARCMALTGYRLDGQKAYEAEIATHFIKSHRLWDFEQRLRKIDIVGSGDSADVAVRDLLAEFDSSSELASCTTAWVSFEVFEESKSVKDLERNLAKLPINAQVQALARGCPFAQHVSWKLLDAARVDLETQGLKENSRLRLVRALERDLASTWRLARRPDFVEGVRATLVDKNDKPTWSCSLAEVNETDAANMLDLVGAPVFSAIGCM